jgi:nucleoside-diphosphate-sugar epimerase
MRALKCPDRLRLPDVIETEEELEDLLSIPYPETIEDLASIKGDIIILGAGGKIGPSLAMTALRAVKCGGLSKRVIAVSRFSRRSVAEKLRDAGVEVIEADLSNEEDVEKLPDVENVVFMVGRKFGTAESPEETWITNAYTPALVAKKFRRSRIVVFSSGNVYPFVKVWSGGATEKTPVNGVGEYAWSVVARERIFTYFSKKFGTPVTILRLNYACELRYGVIVDVALKIIREEPIDVTMSCVNVIWQGDVNNIALRGLKYASSPPRIINVTGPETISVRWLAETLGELLGKKPIIVGNEADDALLSNAAEAFNLFGYPRVPLKRLIQWVAHWIKSGKPVYNLPTHFEVRTGVF